MEDMRKLYRVKLPSGFETTMLMTEDYQSRFWPEATLVRPSNKAGSARHRAKESEADKAAEDAED